jgi:hypothetical protein
MIDHWFAKITTGIVFSRGISSYSNFFSKLKSPTVTPSEQHYIHVMFSMIDQAYLFKINAAFWLIKHEVVKYIHCDICKKNTFKKRSMRFMMFTLYYDLYAIMLNFKIEFLNLFLFWIISLRNIQLFLWSSSKWSI